MYPDAFDVIPFEDIKGDWKKLGSGSFGNVWKGTYLGIDVAIKEVLPSTSYDVSKYFEREWRLMKECRHPNICLFIGLSRPPFSSSTSHSHQPTIYIVSEYIENGNVRSYIHNTSKPFPWPLRISFATDVSRALAYLHARHCIHRDLKGENLLVTSNARLKITDFGFARIAARTPEESKRLTFCGTDSYMSPEILLGEEFDLSTDVFSLGVIFCEIAARKLADKWTFKRDAPRFEMDIEEVRKLASPDCPEEFLELCVDCCKPAPKERPTTREILERLRVIEAEVLARDGGVDIHFGSVRFLGGKRSRGGPRIPSFGVGGSKSGASTSTNESDDEDIPDDETESSSSFSFTAGLNNGSIISNEPLLDHPVDSSISGYSTAVVKSSHHSTTSPPSLSSILTVRPSPDLLLAQTSPFSDPTPDALLIPDPNPNPYPDPLNASSILSIATLDSYYTAPPSTNTSSIISSANATEGSIDRSTIRSLRGKFVPPLVHRFTLLKPGKQKSHNNTNNDQNHGSTESNHAGWNPLEILFSSGLLTGKCDLCTKRIGWKAALECDDCGLRTHVKCGELAPMDCGLHPRRASTSAPPQPSVSPNITPLNLNRNFNFNLNLNAVSSLSKVKSSVSQAQEEFEKVNKKITLNPNSTTPTRR